MNLLEELTFRKLLYAVTDDDLAQKLETESMTFYLGADPTADSLHIGHLVPYIVARHLAARGHKPILLIGGGTGLIGDPSGKKEERLLLDENTVKNNVEAMRKQVLNILPTAQVVNNYDWLKPYNLLDFLREIGKHFGLNAMLAKDSVKSRLESGISFTEFTYQIIQSLDFLKLYQKHRCTLQIGGQDQWGNITAGLELIRKVEGSEAKAYGLVIPLLTKADGTKFGKTESGTIWLDPKRTSPYAFYQYWINLEDAEALSRLRQFTMLTPAEIQAIETAMAESPHLRHAQKAIAEELTVLIHGEAALKQVVNITEALFYNDVTKLSLDEIEMGFEGVNHLETDRDILLIDALIGLKLASSKREARTFIEQNAIAVNGEKVSDTSDMLNIDNALHQRYTVLRRGKKLYGVVKHLK